jgi:hypothetical protein
MMWGHLHYLSTEGDSVVAAHTLGGDRIIRCFARLARHIQLEGERANYAYGTLSAPPRMASVVFVPPSSLGVEFRE